MPPTTTRVCCYLRWRAFEEGDPESRTPQPHAEEGFFLCIHTREAVGPDARAADEGACREGRECYQLPEQPGTRPPVSARQIPLVETVEAESRLR